MVIFYAVKQTNRQPVNMLHDKPISVVENEQAKIAQFHVDKR